jgi:predicted CoA-substrate-specific enzyme activase
MPRYIGIDLGAETLKVAELIGTRGDWTLGRRQCLEHHKNPGGCLRAALEGMEWDGVHGAAVTGRLSRQIGLLRVPLQQALATGTRIRHGTEPITVISIGSRGFSALELRAPGREIFRENGRCAQGTGNFLQQLVGRFGLDVAQAASLAAEVADPAPLSGRCPVILKTDMTHLANKGESKERILAGLLDAIAENVQALLKPRVCPPRLLLAGGVSRSTRVQEHFRRFADRHQLTFLEPTGEDGLFLEAMGAAVLAADYGAGTVPLTALMEPPEASVVETLPSLSAALGRVRHMAPLPPRTWTAPTEILFGFDIGSTGSKAVALDLGSSELVWEGYLGTDGAPVQAAQALLRRFLESPASTHRIKGFGVTGSGREIVGSLLSICYGGEAVWVMNEIAAHATGALSFDPRVDTIFEIGGQDAKYIRLEGGRVVDAAMNEACSAGTGSFIEEQGRRFHGIQDVQHLGRTAIEADGCAALGQHCSIFMAEVMDEAVASEVPQDRIIAGIYHSVVANYLNRVKGSRSVGQVIFCQGMPFASDALAAAVAGQTGAEVIIPPKPGLMGAIGIALLAERELPWASLPVLDGAQFLAATVVAKDQFHCQSTQGCGGAGNKCRIDRLTTRVGEAQKRFTWGGSCSLWDKGIRRGKLPDRGPDPFRERREYLAAMVAGLTVPRGRPRIALTDEFQLQGLLPFYATYLHELGFDLEVPAAAGREALKRGIEEAAIPFCAPMQQYHGLVAEMAEGQPEYLFLPMIRELPRVDGEPHSTICPITQGAPDVLRLNLEGGPRMLSPVVDMGTGFFDSPAFQDSCLSLARELGKTAERRWRAAWRAGRAAQAAFEARLQAIGQTALDYCREHDLLAVAVLGRGYTIHNDVLNSNVPSILREQGAIAIPVDCLPLPGETPTFEEVYWGHSQRILRAAWHVRRTPGLYSIFCSNYSCGPDSFTAHFYSWLMEGKPYSIIETDGHAGDAGTKTRVEAFLHCVREARRQPLDRLPVAAERLTVGSRSFQEIASGEEIILIPSMGPEALAAGAVFRGYGIPVEVLPLVDSGSLAAGRRHTSGKECLPLTFTLGSMLQRVERDPASRFLFLMPTACGPCRLGAYRNLDQLVIERLGLQDRVRVWSPPWGDFLQGLPSGFAALVFTGITAVGILQDALLHVRPAERRPGEAERIHGRWQARLVRHLEKAARGDLSPARVLLEVSTGRAYGIPALLRKALRSLAKADTGKVLPRVLMTGEIYVRLEPFANGFAAKLLNDRGIRVAVESTSDLLRYSDHTAWTNGGKKGPSAHLETWVQQRFADLCHREATRCLGLPPKPATREILHTASSYLREALEGEAVLSLGGPLHAWRQGEIDAAVLAGPLECMPNKLAEAQFTHAAEREGLATLTLSMNGEPLDPELLDTFAFEVHRRCHQGHPRRGAGLPAAVSQ